VQFLFISLIKISNSSKLVIFFFTNTQMKKKKVVVSMGHTRQTMYILCNIEVCLCNICFSRKEITIPYSEGVFVALGIQHVLHTCHTVICRLSGSAVCFHIIA
jgi:hypothetical protein